MYVSIGFIEGAIGVVIAWGLSFIIEFLCKTYKKVNKLKIRDNYFNCVHDGNIRSKRNSDKLIQVSCFTCNKVWGIEVIGEEELTFEYRDELKDALKAAEKGK